MASSAEPIVPPVSVDDEELDPRVVELMKEYESEWVRGTRPDRQEYLNRYQNHSPLLVSCLDGIDLLYRDMTALARLAPVADKFDTHLPSGYQLGEFQIVREIGRGGMGVVYEAVQPALNRRVAIKILPRGRAADRNRLRRFMVEVQAAAAAAHPYIVPVYTIGEHGGINFYAMRLIDGLAVDVLTKALRQPAGNLSSARSLTNPVSETALITPNKMIEQYGRDRPAHHRAVARLGVAVARALDHAHQNGVIHRDIKPANLLLGFDGHIWVTDFGLAHLTAGANVTQTGTAIGTLQYMSPEQTTGDRRLDHRTDVYSLAATLYELATGRPAFTSEEPAILLRQIANDAPPAPRSVDPTVPTDLASVLLKGLEKDPRDRYATAVEFADDLERFLAGRPVLAHRPFLWERARRWAGRHPAVTTAAALFLVLLFAASAVIAALTQRAYRAERARANEAERRFQRSKQLGDLMIQISEEEVRPNAPPHGTRRRLLLAALENYRELLETGHDDPQVRAELDRVRVQIEAMLAEDETTRESWRVRLLWFAPVRVELGLSPDQDEQVQRVFSARDIGPKPTGLEGGAPSSPNERDIFRALADADMRRDLLRLLTVAQRKRLGELHLQHLGPLAFNDPEVVEALALTHAQRQQIRSLLPSVPNRPPTLFPSAPANAKDKNDPALVTARILELLAPQQRDAWRVLIGKPFQAP